MYRKNVAGQFLNFVMLKAADHTALVGSTITGVRSIDGGAQASVTGTFTSKGGGHYELALSQVDTNGNNIGFLFTTATGIPVVFNMITTDLNPYDAVRAGLTALPNAAAEAAGGLFTRGSGAGQIAQQANGQVDANVERLHNSGQSAIDLGDFADTGYNPATHKVAGVVLCDTITTYTGNTPQTGNVGVAGAGLTALGDTRLANLDALVSSRSSHSAADVWASATRTLSSYGTLIADIWAYATRTLSAFTFLDAAETELATAPTVISSLRAKINWLFIYFRNRRTCTSAVETLYKENSTTAFMTRAITDDGTTVDSGKSS